MTATSLRAATTDAVRGAKLWNGPVIDADVHVSVPSLEALYPYLDEVWIAGQRARAPSTAPFYPPATLAYSRPEWRPADGRPPGSSFDLLQDDLLGPLAPDVVILNCTYPIDSGHPDYSVALARAVNDWLRTEWLDRDPRLRGSILLPTMADPAAVVAEIERVAADRRFVQALFPVRSGTPYGKRSYWPVFEAIARNDLVAGIHWGGSNFGLAPSPSGWPSRYIEEYVAEIQVYESQLISLVAEGTFQHIPTLRVTMMDIGFTWVPMWMWDMDRNWKGLRREIPWVTTPPFEIVRDHVRFTVAPLDAHSSDELAEVVSWLGSDELLMFASDYPHTHNDDLSVLLTALSDEARPRVMATNAREWYRLDTAAE